MSRFLGITWIFIFFVAACSSSKSSSPSSSPTNDNDQKAQQSPAQNVYPTFFQVTFTEGAGPNDYQMHVSWPAELGKISFQYGQNNNLGAPAVFDTTTTSFETPVRGGLPVDIVVKSVENSSTANFSVNPPKDLEVQSTVELTQNTYWNYGRIYFYLGGTVVTHGFDLSVNAKEIYISNKITADKKLFQIVTTTSSAAHTVKNPKEYTGSNITINASLATGILKIGMIGINGENGISGEVLSPTSTTPDSSLDGAPGTDAVLKRVLLNYICEKQPTNGHDGKRGATGHDGEDGHVGGNTGSLAVVIPDNTGLQLYITAKVGGGGAGGAGAPGGPGGYGGAAGSRGGKTFCNAAKNGNNGPKGYAGKTGATGKVGQRGTFEYSGIKNAHLE